MAGKLSVRKVETAKAGKFSDGGGLYLVVAKAGSKKWVLRYTWQSKAREMGLGSAKIVPLKTARDQALDAQRLIHQGIDPLLSRQQSRLVPTFGQMAEDVVTSLAPGFRNSKHVSQWRNTLATHAGSISGRSVDSITTEDVRDILAPIWTTIPETASRLRGRIEKVLDAAKARGLRQGENPARWKGNLDHLLPKQQKLSRGHHAALPYKDMASFVAKLRAHNSTASLALQFCILTAARSGEVLGARWSEFDLMQNVWEVPANRMKAGRPHRVPLSSHALDLVCQLHSLETREFVFPGQRKGKNLSNMAMSMMLRRMEQHDITVHGFRSSFRDWAGNETEFAREVIETALAHVIGDKADEQAYRRDDALEKRRKLMEAWGRFCTKDN